MRKVEDAVSGVTRLGLDTAPIIYFVEQNPAYVNTVRALFNRIDSGTMESFTSVITLTEVLTVPIRDGDIATENIYRTRLLYSRNLTTLAVLPVIAERAAALRANYRLRTPDALQIATALHAQCEAFLTNDRGLLRVTDLAVLILEDLEP
jgi:predicted nucleic acid-binding protein